MHHTTKLSILSIAAAAILAGCGGGGSNVEQMPSRDVANIMEGHVDDFCAPHGKNLGYDPIYSDNKRWPM